MQIKLSNYGNLISTDSTSYEIRSVIEGAISDNVPVEIDAKGVVISTKSARLIFGFLYKKLSKINFNKLIQFKDASTTFMFAVNEGIITELETA